MRLIFIGPQGSGKGTQAKIIADKLGIAHISTGDLFRNAAGEVKKELDSYMNAGKLVPDSVVLRMLKKRLGEKDCAHGFVLDGFPRNLKQAEELDKIIKIDKVIEINISDEEAVKRISGRVSCVLCKEGYNELTSPKPKNRGICDRCGGKLVKRADDNETAVRERLKIYHEETEPLLQKYSFIKINGEQDIESVAKDILIALEP